jgi:hypothetical protein
MSLSDLVDKHEQLVKDSLQRNALLPFIVSVPFLLSKKFPSLSGAEFKEEDLFQLISSDATFASLQKLYFCPQKYLPDGEFKLSKDSWPKLKGTLSMAAPNF